MKNDRLPEDMRPSTGVTIGGLKNTQLPETMRPEEDQMLGKDSLREAAFDTFDRSHFDYREELGEEVDVFDGYNGYAILTGEPRGSQIKYIDKTLYELEMAVDRVETGKSFPSNTVEIYLTEMGKQAEHVINHDLR